MAPSRYQDHVEPLSGANHRLLRDISSDRIDSREVNLDIFCDIVADVAQHKADFVWVLDTPPDVRCLTGPADRRSHRPRVRELGSPGMRPTGLSLPGLRKPAHRCRIPHRASTQICQRSGKPCCRPQLVHPLTRNPQLIRDLSRRHQLGRCERLSAQTMLWLANDLHSNGTLGLNYRHNLANHLGERVEHTPIAGRIDRDVNAVSWDPRYQCVEALELRLPGVHGLHRRVSIKREGDDPVGCHCAPSFLCCARRSFLLGGGHVRPAFFNAPNRSRIRRYSLLGVAGNRAI